MARRNRDLPLLLAAAGIGYLLLQRRATGAFSAGTVYYPSGLPLEPDYIDPTSPNWYVDPAGWETIRRIRESGQAGGFI